jgi:hypothetical protein
LYYKNILADQTQLASKILCINETKIKNIYANKEIHNALLEKFSILCSYEQHGMMMLFGKNYFNFKMAFNNRPWCKIHLWNIEWKYT